MSPDMIDLAELREIEVNIRAGTVTLRTKDGVGHKVPCKLVEQHYNLATMEDYHLIHIGVE